MRVCLCVQEGGKVTVSLCACLSGRSAVGRGDYGSFWTKMGGRGRRVDGRTGESRGRSVRVKREEEEGGAGVHPLILSPSP